MKQVKWLSSIIMVMMTTINAVYAQNAMVEANNLVYVGYQATTMLVFPAPIERTDCGSADLLVKPDKKEGCVLKIKASQTDFIPTNLTVFTKDGWMYSMRIIYSENPSQLVYDCGGKDSLKVTKILHDKLMNPVRIEQCAELVAQIPLGYHRPFSRKGGMRMSFLRVFIKEDILFFAFHITNGSRIPYDIQLTRFYTKDREQRKRSSQTEQEIIPLFQYITPGRQIKNRDKAAFVIAFNKFTIADHKYFITELLEKNGDRELRIRLSGKFLLNSFPIK